MAVELKNNPYERQKYIKAHMLEVKRLYENGSSVNMVAKAFGLSWKTVEKYLLQAGIQVEHRNTSGVAHHSWNGGIKNRGYIYIHPENYLSLPHYKRYVRRSRWVWEQAHGPIPEGYEVHHLNGVKDDDRLENLCLLEKKIHGKNIPQREFIKRLQAKIRRLERALRSKGSQCSFLKGGDEENGGQTAA